MRGVRGAAAARITLATWLTSSRRCEPGFPAKSGGDDAPLATGSWESSRQFRCSRALALLIGRYKRATSVKIERNCASGFAGQALLA
jgi:hypothetical protein